MGIRTTYRRSSAASITERASTADPRRSQACPHRVVARAEPWYAREMKRILVTGGAGFLGSHLCERLLERGEEVICLDNFFTGSRHNVEHLLENPRFEVVRHDVTQPMVVEVDQIYHLACPASPIHYQRNPVRTIRTTVHGTLNMLDLAREVHARILLASTSEV